MGQWRGELLWWEYARKRRKWGFPLPPPRQTAAMAQSSLKLPRVLAKDTGGRSVLLCGALGTSARLRTQRPADPESWSRPAGLVTGWIRVGLPLLTAAFLSGFCFRGLWGHRGKPGSQEPLCLVLLQLNTPSCPQSMPSACTALPSAGAVHGLTQRVLRPQWARGASTRGLVFPGTSYFC